MPTLEPWLIVCLLAFVPGVLMVFLPHETLRSALLPIIGSMVVLSSAGFAMLWQATRRERNDTERQRDHAHAGGARDQ